MARRRKKKDAPVEKQRGNITVYYADQEMPERWQAQAARLGMSVSNLVANVLDTLIPIIEETPKEDIGNIGKVVQVPEENDSDGEPGEGDSQGDGGEEAEAGAEAEAEAEGEGTDGEEEED